MFQSHIRALRELTDFYCNGFLTYLRENLFEFRYQNERFQLDLDLKFIKIYDSEGILDEVYDYPKGAKPIQFCKWRLHYTRGYKANIGLLRVKHCYCCTKSIKKQIRRALR